MATIVIDLLQLKTNKKNRMTGLNKWKFTTNIVWRWYNFHYLDTRWTSTDNIWIIITQYDGAIVLYNHTLNACRLHCLPWRAIGYRWWYCCCCHRWRWWWWWCQHRCFRMMLLRCFYRCSHHSFLFHLQFNFIIIDWQWRLLLYIWNRKNTSNKLDFIISFVMWSIAIK